MGTALRNDWSQGVQNFYQTLLLIEKWTLSASIKLTLHRELIKSVITYACPAWEIAADTYLLKLQRLQNKVLHTIGNFPWCIPVRDMHTAFNLPCVYDCVTTSCRKQAEVIRNHENEHVRGIGQCKARHKIYYKRLELGGGDAYDRSSD
jgi:hypothetical protein